jgi:CheY-like chemotaxis protein
MRIGTKSMAASCYQHDREKGCSTPKRWKEARASRQARPFEGTRWAGFSGRRRRVCARRDCQADPLRRVQGANVQPPKTLLSEQLPEQNACLIADIYLPEMNGVELCHTLALTGRPLRTILITGRNDEMTRRLVEKSEAVAVLFKPIDEVPLFDAISRCLNL